MTTDAIANESEDYKLGYEAGYEAGKEALKKEIESSDRELTEFYSSSSYAFLSDSEVRKLIEFKEYIARTEEEAIAIKASIQAKTEMMDASIAASCADIKSVLESILANTPQYEGVTPTAITDFLTNNNEV